MADRRTISQLEAERYFWIAATCCKGAVWVPLQMIRQQFPMLSAMTLDEVGAKLRCEHCGRRPERYHAARQEDAPGYARTF